MGMERIVRGALSVSLAIRRQTSVPHRWTQLRRIQSSTTNHSPSEPPSPATAAENANTQTPPHGSATASAGAPVPSIPERPSRSLRQIMKASPLGKAVGWYSRQQHGRPYWTQVWSTLIIYLCADLCAQLLVSSDEASEAGELQGEVAAAQQDEDQESTSSVWANYDGMRTARHLTVGVVAAIPVYRWFMFLHHHFNYASKARSILTKVAVSQSIFTPIFNTYFFAMQSLLAGASLHDTWERLKKAVPNSIMNSAKLWPGVTAFLFLYVEPQFRSIVSGIVAVGWQAYLSWLNQKAAREVREAAIIEAAELLQDTGSHKGALLHTP
ncbi:hypothetical protein LOZ35_000708 [Ophidiomyces ophidiicola]|nr:hypothetical protein LOZ35_000708 [Ophidiomyces ophidiicola]